MKKQDIHTMELNELFALEAEARDSLPKSPNIDHMQLRFSAPLLAEIVYAFFDADVMPYKEPTCVFTGCNTYAGSSINYVEKIVESIQKVHNLHLEQWRFYDLQTHQGYRKTPGTFHYDRVTYYCDDKKGDKGMHWAVEECPEIVYRTFLEYIGSTPTISYSMQLEFPNIPYEGLLASIEIERRKQATRSKKVEELLSSKVLSLISPEEAREAGFRLTNERSNEPQMLERCRKEYDNKGFDAVIVDALFYPPVRFHANAHDQIGRFSLWIKKNAQKISTI